MKPSSHGCADPKICPDCRPKLGGSCVCDGPGPCPAHTWPVTEVSDVFTVQARRAWESSPARRLVEHIRASGVPESGAWAEAIETFSYLVYGTSLASYARATFDARFGLFDWPAELTDDAS